MKNIIKTSSRFKNYQLLKIFLLLAFLNSTITAIAQPATPPTPYSSSMELNYVRTWTALAPESNATNLISRPVTDVSQETQYFDGFGRSIETVAKQASPLQNDIVTAQVYDQYGRQELEYLPFVSNVAQTGDVKNDGNFKIDPIQQQVAFYNSQLSGQAGETNIGSNNLNWAYSKNVFESSPLNRITENYQPGSSWVGGSRGTSTEYLVNTATDNVRIWQIAASQGSIPTSSSSYAAGQLYKIITTDESGHQTIEFKNTDGQTILKKVQLTASPDNGSGSSHAGWLCTYYVYDDYNNLRFIITPKAVELIDGSWAISQIIADELCYRYEYDLKGENIIKKIPGAGEDWYVYDELGRKVMSQNADQRNQEKWQYYQYDNLNRLVATGLLTDPTNYNNLSYHQNLAASSTSYPNLGSYTTELLSQTYYDNYNWVSGTGLSSSLDQTNISNTSYFYTPSNSSFPYPQQIAQSTATTGLTTGTKTEVLGSNGSQYLYSVFFYDDKGRLIQSQSTNITGGVDKVTNQYSWSGNVLRSLVEHNKNGTNAQSHKLLMKLSYDDQGRLLSSTETIFSTIGSTQITTPEKTLATYTYSELGQVKTKSIGMNPNTGLPFETQTFDYNIRGWLTGINKDFTTSGSTSNYFGMEIGYDKSGTTNGTTSFTPVYNGNISGEIWKDKGDNIPREYSYTYDNASRLTSAAFSQNTSGSSWDHSNVDFSVNNVGYDYNGNITALNQNGYMPGGSTTIDNLSYNYLDNGSSNKLMNVIDNANNPQSQLGDFHYSGTKTASSVDYTYDGNGNQISDANKGITSITYNALNLPQTITFGSKGSISYTYDASGNKLKTVVQENNATVNKGGTNYTTNITTTTTYIGPFVYKSLSFSNSSLLSLQYTDVLQYISNSEGRARLITLSNGSQGYAFDYFIRDNLGNIRTVLTDEQQQDTYPAATLEPSAINTEENYYKTNGVVVSTSDLPWYSSVSGGNYQNNNGLPYPPDPTINRTGTSATVLKLNGASGYRYGMYIALKVMAGDQISIFGKSFWHSLSSVNNSYSINNILSTFLSSFAGTNEVISAGKGSITGASLDNSSVVTSAMSTFLNNVPTPSQSPKAYINWIVMDDQFKVIQTSSGSDPISTTADLVKSHSILGINIPKDGYIFIYCSNESNQDVFFDNLQVVHTRGPILDESNYYPDGLTMVGISDSSYGKLHNMFGYQSKEMQNAEFTDGTGLEEYDFGARYYDDQLGRWNTPDPVQQFASPYLAMGDSWVDQEDPNGDYALWDDIAAMAIGAVANVATNWGSINSVGSFFSYLGVGALSGEATLYGGPLAGGAIMGLGNNLIQQVSTGGWNNLDYGSLMGNAVMGGLTSFVGGELGGAISSNLPGLFAGIGSPVLRQVAIQSVTGATSGFVIGTGTSLLEGNSLNSSLSSGLNGALFGLGQGVITGTVAGIKTGESEGRNPFTGRLLRSKYELEPITGGRVGMVRIEPQSLEEKLTLQEAQSGQGREIMKGKINDSNFQGWMKMEHIHVLPDGSKIIIHYWYNPSTGEVIGFKFKSPPLPNPSINLFPLNLR